jgi:hypothetical protein
MSYCTEAQVRAATPFKSTSLIASAYVTDKIAAADSIINAKISKVYQIPLAVSGATSTPDIIEEVSIKIASALLYLEQFSEETAGSGIDGAKLLEEAIKILDDIEEQKQRLVNAAGVEYDRSTFMNPVGYPNQSSTDDGDTEPLFTIDQKF